MAPRCRERGPSTPSGQLAQRNERRRLRSTASKAGNQQHRRLVTPVSRAACRRPAAILPVLQSTQNSLLVPRWGQTRPSIGHGLRNGAGAREEVKAVAMTRSDKLRCRLREEGALDDVVRPQPGWAQHCRRCPSTCGIENVDSTLQPLMLRHSRNRPVRTSPSGYPQPHCAKI
jgi:hypothetical protein